MILLNADEHRQWEAAVATWPTCSACDGNGWTVEGPNYHDPYGDKIECAECVAGRVPQPVYIVIEGEPSAAFPTDGLVVPERWDRAVGEPCEIRAECPTCCATGNLPGTNDGEYIWIGCGDCFEGSVFLASAATVEVVPVTDVWPRGADHTQPVTAVVQGGVLYIEGLDPLPVPGRHFVAVVTPGQDVAS